MGPIKLLSIIVPVYQQEKSITRDLGNLSRTLAKLKIPYELIVVDDYSTDNTSKILSKIHKKNIFVFRNAQNYGKGYTVKYGMLKARGNIIGFLDGGRDIDPESIIMLLNHMKWYDADIIVGSKLHPVSQVSYPLGRKILSRGYRGVTRILFGFKVRDTQVGLKIFKRKVVRDVFPQLLVKKFAFDIEVLAVAHSLGYTRIFEAPVKLQFGASSITSKNFWQVILHMLWDTAAVFYRIKIIHHYNEKVQKNRKLGKTMHVQAIAH